MAPFVELSVSSLCIRFSPSSGFFVLSKKKTRRGSPLADTKGLGNMLCDFYNLIEFSDFIDRIEIVQEYPGWCIFSEEIALSIIDKNIDGLITEVMWTSLSGNRPDHYHGSRVTRTCTVLYSFFLLIDYRFCSPGVHMSFSFYKNENRI